MLDIAKMAEIAPKWSKWAQKRKTSTKILSAPSSASASNIEKMAKKFLNYDISRFFQKLCGFF
jgi:hypothetical protein